jgi:hypothetical protein
MTRIAADSSKRHHHFKPLALALLLSALSGATWASPQTTLPLSGVRNSTGPRRLNESQLQSVQASLRQKTGWPELSFDQQGVLTLGTQRHSAGGSATARALLAAALSSAHLYELESHESSPAIAFAQIVESVDRLIDETPRRTHVYQVQLDFADFHHLHGARAAKASFDLGIALLHELVHGVLQLQDPQGGLDQIGECDAHVNQMRRELQLPERLYYHPGIAVTQVASGKHVVHARLVFVERAAAHAKPSAEYSLYWLPGQVSPKAQNIAAWQQGWLAARRR